LIDKVQGIESDYLNNADKFLSIIGDVYQGSNKEALATYATLPENLKRDKMLALARLRAALVLGADSSEYASASDDILTFFPGESWTDLIAVDVYNRRHKYDKALAAVDRLDMALGGDPYLDSARADVLFNMGQLQEAKTLARKSLRAEPAQISAYTTLLSAALLQGNFRAVNLLLSELEEKRGLDMSKATATADYADFLKSDEGRKWLESRPAKKPAAPKPAGKKPTP
jgi:predicted Zn-dependent protease